MGCSVTPCSCQRVAILVYCSYIELDGKVQETFPFGDGRELFNPCKTIDPVIEDIWRTKIFKFNIFVIHKVLPKFMKMLSHEYLEPYSIAYL